MLVGCTSTAGKEVAGCTGGGAWSAAIAGNASQSRTNGIPRKILIVFDCIILGSDTRGAGVASND